MAIIKLPDPEGQTDRERGYELRQYTAAQMHNAIVEERERCANLAEKQLPPTEEECPQHWKAYEVAWRVRQLVAQDIAAAIRSQ